MMVFNEMIGEIYTNELRQAISHHVLTQNLKRLIVVCPHLRLDPKPPHIITIVQPSLLLHDPLT